MNRQQNHDPERSGLYEALSSQFRMPEADVDWLEQKLRLRAAALVQAEEEQKNAPCTAIKQTKTDEIYGFMRRFRLIPLAACFAVCLGLMWTFKTKFPSSEVSTVSENITEITATDTTSHTTDTTTHTTFTHSTHTTTTDRTTASDVATQTTISLNGTEDTVTETLAADLPDTPVPETEADTELASVTLTTKDSTQQSSKTTASTTQTSASEISDTTEETVQTTLAQPESGRWIEVESKSVKPGELASCHVWIDGDPDLEAYGFQVYFVFSAENGNTALPVFTWYPDVWELDESYSSSDFSPSFRGNTEKDWASIIWVSVNGLKPIQERTGVATLYFQIPDDVPAGTVFRIIADPLSDSAYVKKDLTSGKLPVIGGQLTVTN